MQKKVFLGFVLTTVYMSSTILKKVYILKIYRINSARRNIDGTEHPLCAYVRKILAFIR